MNSFPCGIAHGASPYDDVQKGWVVRFGCLYRQRRARRHSSLRQHGAQVCCAVCESQAGDGLPVDEDLFDSVLQDEFQEALLSGCRRGALVVSLRDAVAYVRFAAIPTAL